MTFEIFLQTDIFNWVIMPILIILSRIFDVALGTIRVVFISRGYKNVTALVGFFEVLIWIIVVRQIFTDVTNPVWFLAYAAGFGLGTYIGIIISEKLSMGEVLVRIITAKDSTLLIDRLKEDGYGVTIIESQGKHNKGKIIFSVIHSKDLDEVVSIIHKTNPKAFFTVEDIRKVNEGQFKTKKRRKTPSFSNLLHPFRKGK